jgi:hypothetical protein
MTLRQRSGLRRPAPPSVVARGIILGRHAHAVLLVRLLVVDDGDDDDDDDDDGPRRGRPPPITTRMLRAKSPFWSPSPSWRPPTIGRQRRRRVGLVVQAAAPTTAAGRR